MPSQISGGSLTSNTVTNTLSVTQALGARSRCISITPLMLTWYHLLLSALEIFSFSNTTEKVNYTPLQRPRRSSLSVSSKSS